MSTAEATLPAVLPDLSASASAPGEWVRLRGVVAGEGAALVRLRLRATGYDRALAPQGRARILLDSGGEVEISAENGLIARPLFVKRGAWETLESTREGALLREVAPGPHVKTEISGFVLWGGDSVEVLGRVTETGFAPHSGGARDAATHAPRVVLARLLASGADAPARLEALFHQEKRAEGEDGAAESRVMPMIGRWGLRVVLALTGLSLLLFLMRTAESTWGGVSTGLWFLSWGFFFYNQRLAGMGNQFWNTAQPSTSIGTGLLSLLFLIILGIYSVFGVVPLFFSSLSDHQFVSTFSDHLRFVMPAALALWAVLFWHGGADRRRVQRLLLGAPKLSARSASGSWGSVEGVADDLTPVSTPAGEAALALEIRVDRTRTSSNKHSLSSSYHILVDGSFVLRSGEQLFTVDPQGALWSSVAPTKKHSQRVDDKTTRDSEFVLLPPGGKVLLAGRLQRDAEGRGSFAAAGPESLVMFSVEPNQDPRSELSVRMISSYAFLVWLLLASVAQYWFSSVMYGILVSR